MRKGRIDYRMRRRATLRDVREGLTSLDDARDAHPYLLRAAEHIGSPIQQPCPLCEGSELRLVDYIFEQKGSRTPGGRAIPRAELASYADRYGALQVYTVEVCLACHWHHLLESYLYDLADTDASHG